MRFKKRDQNTWQAMTKTNYTFGDSDEASLRLRNLANLYELDTRSVLKRSEVNRPVMYSSGPVLEKPAQLMAELHLANIRSWRHDKYASQSFDAGEMDLLESSLRRIASGMENAGIVLNTARQIIAQA